MGFWHTGYFEFHEEVGLENIQVDDIPAPKYRCDQCDAVFDSQEALRTHRFEKHPLERPMLMIRGVEVGRQPFQIKTPLSPSDVTLLSADEVVVNGRTTSAAELGQVLSQYRDGTVNLQFGDGAGEFSRVIHFRIASSEDLVGVEKCFLETAAGGRLDRRAIDHFIAASKQFRTAEAYYDGICEYLYGVLAKERSSHVDIPYERYRDKLNRSMESLADIHRPLARHISSLIDFNFNLIVSAEQRSPKNRVGIASARLRAWARGEMAGATAHISPRTTVDRALTDADTEAIVAWACKDLSDLAKHLDEIEEFSCKPLAELDKSKCHIIIATVSYNEGQIERAIKHARELYHLEDSQFSARFLVELIRSASLR